MDAVFVNHLSVAQYGAIVSLIPPKPLPAPADELAAVSADWIARARFLMDRGILFNFDLAGQPACTCPAGTPPTTPCLACLASAASRRMAERAERRPAPLLPWENPWDDDPPEPEDV